MRAPILGFASLVAGFILSTQATGHFLPINTFLDEHNQIYIDPGFDAGPLQLIGNTLILTDLPGVGILSPGNDISNGSPIEINVIQQLLYWDGATVVPTTAELLIDAPTMDGFGNPNNSPVPSYTITQSSGYQAGMLWGTYDSVFPGWDAHGIYSMTPSTADPGVYGITAQLTSPGMIGSEHFLIAFEYDPNDLFTAGDVATGTLALQAEVVESLTGDINRNATVGPEDYTIWANNFGIAGLNVPGDENDNGSVGPEDYTLWANHFGESLIASPSSAEIQSVPEPSSIVLVLAATTILLATSFGRSRRRADGRTTESTRVDRTSL